MRRGRHQRVGESISTGPDYVRALEDRLTEEGLSSSRVRATPDQTLLIACGALAREILAVNQANGWDNAVLECLPAKLHNAPEHIPEAVRAKIKDARNRGFDSIFVLYADCGTGGHLDTVCEEESVERIAGPHCYAFFDGLDAFQARAEEEMRALYLTDFFAKQFDALIWKGFGLDRHPEMRNILFEHYDRLVYLAQTDDSILDAKAKDAAERLDLKYERRFTGYGELADALTALAHPTSDFTNRK